MSRPYVNESFARQGERRRKHRTILIMILLAALCLEGILAAAIAMGNDRGPEGNSTLPPSSQPQTGHAAAPLTREPTVPLPGDALPPAEYAGANATSRFIQK